MFYLYYKTKSTNGGDTTKFESYSSRDVIDQRFNEVIAEGAISADIIEGHALVQQEIDHDVIIRQQLSVDELQASTLDGVES